MSFRTLGIYESSSGYACSTTVPVWSTIAPPLLSTVPSPGAITIAFLDKEFDSLYRLFSTFRDGTPADRSPFPSVLTGSAPTSPSLSHDLNLKARFAMMAFEDIQSVLCGSWLNERMTQWNTQLADTIKNNQGAPIVVSFENNRLQYSIEAALFQMKSFLDVAAISTGHLVGLDIREFKSDFDPASKSLIAGGRYLQILATADVAHASLVAAVATLVRQHQPLWLNRMVTLRNAVVHNRTLTAEVSLASQPLPGGTAGFHIVPQFDGEPINVPLGQFQQGFKQLVVEYVALLKEA